MEMAIGDEGDDDIVNGGNRIGCLLRNGRPVQSAAIPPTKVMVPLASPRQTMSGRRSAESRGITASAAKGIAVPLQTRQPHQKLQRVAGVAVALLIAGSAATVSARAQTASPSYTVAAIPALAGDDYSAGWKINTAGHVAGESGSADGSVQHPVVFQSGASTQLGEAGGAGTAVDVDDQGRVAGSFQPQPDALTRHAALWENGKVKDLGTLGGEGSIASAINESGQIVGASTREPGQSYFAAGTRGFVYRDGKLSALRPLDGSDVCIAAAISDTGVIVGSCAAPGTSDLFASPVAVIWIDGQAVDLTTLLPAGSG